MNTANNAGRIQELSQVKVSTIPDRSGQILRNQLLAYIPLKPSKEKRYLLNIDLEESESKFFFRKDSTARQRILKASVIVKLIDQRAGKEVYTGPVRRVTSHTVGAKSEFGSFSTEVARKNAQEKMLKVLAEDIKLIVTSAIQRYEMTENES